MLVVLMIPDAAHFARRVFQLLKPPLKVRVGSRRGAAPARSPEISQPIDENRSEPRAEGAGPSAVFKRLEIFRDSQQHFLHEVVDIARLDVVLTQPGFQQRRIKGEQPVPWLAISRLTDSNEQT